MLLKKSLLIRDLDKKFAFIGLILSLVLIILYFKNNHINYLLIGVLFLISCIVWLGIRQDHNFLFNNPQSKNSTILYAICFFCLYIVSILSVSFRDEYYSRPLIYFVLISVMASIIASEIIYCNKKHFTLIFSQIVLLGINVSWSQLFLFPSVLGVDPWYHSFLTNLIILKGFIPEGHSYSSLPLFHLIITETSLFSNLPYKFAAMLTVSLGMIICNAFFVYLIAESLFKNYRIGLLAALSVIIANNHIFMTYWSIPNGFAAIFILIAIFFFLFKNKYRFPFSLTLLYLILFITIIFTHTITALCLSILLFVIWLIFFIYREYQKNPANHVPLIVPISFTIAMFAWWTYASGSIRTLVELLKWGFNIDFFIKTPPELLDYSISVNLNEQIINNIGMYLFFAISFIGIFYMISSQGNIKSYIIAWLGITPLSIGFFSLITGHSVIEQRWWFFAQLFLSIPLAVAIYIIITWKTKRNYYSNILVFMFIFFLSFFSVISPAANSDNFFAPNSHMRYSLSESELTTAQTILNKSDDHIKTDSYFAYSQKWEYPRFSTFCQELYSNNFHSLKNQIILVREVIVNKPFLFFSSIYKLDYNLNVKLEEWRFSLIYNSKSVKGYRLQ